MKNKLLKIFNIGLIATAPVGLVATLSSCSKVDTPHDNLKLKLVDFITCDELGEEITLASLLLWVDKESKQPYISLSDYVDYIFNVEMSKYTDICKYKATVNSYNHTATAIKLDGKENTADVAKMTIDCDANTITFSNYITFVDPEKLDNGLDIGSKDYPQYFIADKQKTNWYNRGNQRVIDLNKYGFKTYFINNNVYLPFYVLRNTFARMFVSEYVYNGNDYMIDASKLSESAKRSQLPNFLANGMYNEKYMEEIVKLNFFNFNEFFYLDKKTHPLTGEEIVFPKDDKLKEAFNTESGYFTGKYSELFKNSGINVFRDAMTEFGYLYFNDGGHTITSQLNMLCDQNYKTVTDWNTKGMYSNTSRTLNSLNSGRKDAQKDPSLVPEGQPKITPYAVTGSNDAIGCYVEYSKDSDPSHNISYITFDSFKAPSSQLKPESITKDNYFLDTMSLIHYSNNQIRQHGTKNLVIDISVNGGGAATALSFVLSWICNGATEIFFNRQTNSSLSTTYYADVNLDGKFDENDVLPTDVDLYFITSNGSFSCGNALPVFAKIFGGDRRIKYIGERSGGGSCVVMSGIETGLGSQLRLSGPVQLGGIGCSMNNLIDNEDGVPVDYAFTLNKSKKLADVMEYEDKETFMNFYNRKSINEAIWAK